MIDEKWTVGEFYRFYGREAVEIIEAGTIHKLAVADVAVIDTAWTDDESERIAGPETMKRARVIAEAPQLAALLLAIWERRATVDELGRGYDVRLDGALCDEIRATLERLAIAKRPFC